MKGDRVDEGRSFIPQLRLHNKICTNTTQSVKHDYTMAHG